MSWFKNLFREKVDYKEALEILDLSGIPFISMHIVYLMIEAGLTEAHKIGRREIFFYKDELLNLRDSNHPALQTLRRNRTIGKNGMLKNLIHKKLVEGGLSNKDASDAVEDAGFDEED